MRVGTLCYATAQGLGYLAKDFFDEGVVTDVMVVAHGRRPEHPEWYPGSERVGDLHGHDTRRRLADWVSSLDVFLAFETPFVWGLLSTCRQAGVKTVLMPMHECMPREMPGLPDLFLCPSLLDLQWAATNHPGVRAVHLTVPVPRWVTWRRRERAEVFVHNAGWGGLKGRNGTAEVIGALDHVRSPARFIIRSQEEVWPHGPRRQPTHAGTVEFRVGTFSQKELWGEGDVFVFPEKWNGLSLPLQEAFASGMLVMATGRFPNTEWLPHGPLIPVKEYRTGAVSPRCCEFREAVVEPRTIAMEVDAWYGVDLGPYSDAGRQWAEKNSWDVLGPCYRAVLGELVGG